MVCLLKHKQTSLWGIFVQTSLQNSFNWETLEGFPVWPACLRTLCENHELTKQICYLFNSISFWNETFQLLFLVCWLIICFIYQFQSIQLARRGQAAAEGVGSAGELWVSDTPIRIFVSTDLCSVVIIRLWFFFFSGFYCIFYLNTGCI